MSSWKKLTLLLAAVALLPACGSDTAVGVEPVAEPAERVVPVRTSRLELESVTDEALLSADLLPWRRATLAAEVPGTVEKLTADVGDRVVAGRILVSIDTRALQQQLAEAEALHVQAVDRHERAESLYEKRSITKQAHADAVAGRDVAAARLASMRLLLEKSEVKAPWTGRVASRRVEVGDYASPGQPLIELLQIDRLKVRGAAPAADVPYLALGSSVTVRVDAFPGEVFEGQVVRLGAELDPNTRTLDVDAVLANGDGRLRPGLFGQMRISLRTLEEALLVPLVALVDFEQERVVYVVVEGRASRRTVELGPVVGERVVVISGLEAGDRVVVGGQRRVAEGQAVAELEEG